MCQMNRWHRWHIPCLRKEHVRVKGRGVICLSQRKVTISSCWRKTRSRLSLPGGLVSVLYDTHVPNEWCGGMRGGRGIRSRQFLKCIDQQYPGGWAYLRKVSAHTRYRTTDLFITNEMLYHWAIWARHTLGVWSLITASLFEIQFWCTQYGARTHDHTVKSRALFQLS